MLHAYASTTIPTASAVCGRLSVRPSFGNCRRFVGGTSSVLNAGTFDVVSVAVVVVVAVEWWVGELAVIGER